jgi:alpha-L-rhamnosidase
MFSWVSNATTANWTQSAYEILVDPDANHLRAGHAASWDSGRVASSESLNIAYAGLPLKSLRRYAWKVIAWDSERKLTASVTTLDAIDCGHCVQRYAAIQCSGILSPTI